jgi:nucleotide-binding universal stress UspA family protein
MVFVVPFDGSELAAAALVRAVEFSTVLDEDVLAVSVIPERNTSYARDRGWLDADEAFELKTVVARLHDQVTDVAPSADFRHYTVDRYAPPGTIASTLEDAVREVGASMVFVGSENAGRIVTGVGSVGARVASEETYDVVIVRNPGPAKASGLERSSPLPESKSGLY